jgi:hypothetical protein
LMVWLLLHNDLITVSAKGSSSMAMAFIIVS